MIQTMARYATGFLFIVGLLALMGLAGYIEHY